MSSFLPSAASAWTGFSSRIMTTRPEAMAGWAPRAPAGSRFCLRAQRGLTYSADAFDREGLAGRVGLRLRALGTRLGPALLQSPPTRQREPALLDRLLTALGVR